MSSKSKVLLLDDTDPMYDEMIDYLGRWGQDLLVVSFIKNSLFYTAYLNHKFIIIQLAKNVSLCWAMDYGRSS